MWGDADQDCIVKVWDTSEENAVPEAIKEGEVMFRMRNVGVTPKLIALGWATQKVVMYLVIKKLFGRHFEVKPAACGMHFMQDSRSLPEHAVCSRVLSCADLFCCGRGCTPCVQITLPLI